MTDVLVLEDDESSGVLLTETIRLLGWTSVLVEDVASAVEWLRTDTVRILLLDRNLKGELVDGALAELRHLAPGAQLVVVSADATERARTDVLAAGADHYLTKPIDIAFIETFLGDVLSPATE